jgi:hypothetical protein
VPQRYDRPHATIRCAHAAQTGVIHAGSRSRTRQTTASGPSSLPHDPQIVPVVCAVRARLHSRDSLRVMARTNACAVSRFKGALRITTYH